MPPYYDDIYGQSPQDEQPYSGGSPGGGEGGGGGGGPLLGSDFLSAFLPELAKYLATQNELSRQQSGLARNVVSGVSPFDMLYGSQNPSAPYGAAHEEFWSRMFPQSPTGQRIDQRRQQQEY